MTRIVVLILPQLLVAVNVVLTLALFLGINRRLGKLRKQLAACQTSAQVDLPKLTRHVDEVGNRVAEMEKDTAGRRNLESPACALNGMLRAKVLKMYRLGQPVERISETLRVPRGEIDLLVKVHGIVMDAYERVPHFEKERETSQKSLNDLSQVIDKGLAEVRAE